MPDFGIQHPLGLTQAAGDARYVELAGDTMTGALGLAGLLRHSVSAGIVASTTQTQGQQPLVADINEIATIANVNDTVTLPAAVAGLEIIIINNGANTLQYFPAVGDDIAGAGVDVAVTLGAGLRIRYVAFDSTNWENI